MDTYVNHEPDGSWTIRQIRFSDRMYEHPHDVCAVAMSYDQLKEVGYFQEAFESPAKEIRFELDKDQNKD